MLTQRSADAYEKKKRVLKMHNHPKITKFSKSIRLHVYHLINGMVSEELGAILRLYYVYCYSAILSMSHSSSFHIQVEVVHSPETLSYD